MSDTMKVEIIGLNEVLSSLQGLEAELTAEVGKALYATALETLSDVKRSMEQSPRTGRIYRKGARGTILHRASAPGEPPAVDTGALLRSMYHGQPGPLEVVIGSNSKHSLALEFGSLNGKLKKRPAWIPAAERARPRLQKRVERLVAELTKKAQSKG